MGPDYDKLIDSDWADVKNIGDAGRLNPGSITAAHFLKRFIDGELPWAHLDIAGVTWTKKDLPTVPKGCTGWGVRLLDAFVRENFEG
jgi:leucyl aminopeptidase